jgi:hypothetical protein
VQEIRAVERGRLRVVCVKEKARVALDVALASDAEKAMPPATAGRYAVFYELHDATPEDGERLAKALARVLGANASAPAPPGLTVFQPRGDEGVSL